MPRGRGFVARRRSACVPYTLADVRVLLCSERLTNLIPVFQATGRLVLLKVPRRIRAQPC